MSRVPFVAARVRRSLLLAFVCLGAAAAQAQAPAPLPDVAGPWVGRWMNYVGGQASGLCQLSFLYTAEGRGELVSGQARTLLRYSVLPTAGADGFHEMTSQFLEDNGKPNCGGQVTGITNDLFKSRVRTHQKDRWIELCEGPKERQRCLVLWRVEAPAQTQSK